MSDRGKPCAQACNSVSSQPIRLVEVFRGAGKVPFSTWAAMLDGDRPTIVQVVSRSTMTGSMCTTRLTRSVPPLGVQLGTFFGRPISGATWCVGGCLAATNGKQFIDKRCGLPGESLAGCLCRGLPVKKLIDPRHERFTPLPEVCQVGKDHVRKGWEFCAIIPVVSTAEEVIG